MLKPFLYILFLAPLACFAQSYSGPESVDCDTISGNWYISNTGSKKILRRSADGVLHEFLSGFSSGPYGIEVVGDRIYACDGNKVKGFLLSDGSPVLSVTTTASFLNGITHDDAGYLYATDFSGKKIYKINPSNSSWNVFVAQTTTTPNGILFDPGQNRLVYVSWGAGTKIMAVSLADSSISILKTTTLSNIDGIARDGSGRWYVASWGANAVHRINSDFSGTPEQVLSGMSQPADIYYNQQTDTLAIPNAGNNTVVFAGFAAVSQTQENAAISQLMVYPNPATDQMRVPLPSGWRKQKTICRVIAANGMEYRLQPNEGGDPYIVFHISNLPTGTYQLILSQGNITRTATFLKM